MELEFRPLHPAFGAELVRGELAADMSSATIAELIAAVDRYQLIVVRNAQPLPVEVQVASAQAFGPVLDNGGGCLWSVLDNDDAQGRIRLPFHCDFTYTEFPLELITLSALELPAGGTTTSFVSNVANWASLPAHLQARLAPLSLRHRHASQIDAAMPEFVAEHPICKLHPRTGAPMLFVTEMHADRIAGLDPTESDRLLAEVFAHAFAERQVYTHRWQPGDLLIWDNLAAQHARREAAEPSQGKRAVRRVVVGRATFPELVEAARRQQTERDRRVVA